MQTLFPLTGGAMLKLTISRLVRPSGALLEAAGVVPDVCVKEAGSVFLDPKRVRRFAEAQKLCPPYKGHYHDEHDDIVLRVALDLLHGSKKLACLL